MTVAEIRAEDPAIKHIIRVAVSVNLQNPELDAIKKILIEGVDGRFLTMPHDERYFIDL